MPSAAGWSAAARMPRSAVARPRMFQASLNSDTSIGFGGIADEHDSMSGFERIGTRRLALVVAFALPAILTPFTSIFAATLTILNVEHLAHCQDFTAPTCRAILPSKWRMPASRISVSGRWQAATRANRVEWSFKLDPYAGGEVRSFVHQSTGERLFGVHRPVTIKARLYLRGKYRRLVSEQVIIEGGRQDPDLAAAVAHLTEDLLAHKGRIARSSAYNSSFVR